MKRIEISGLATDGTACRVSLPCDIAPGDELVTLERAFDYLDGLGAWSSERIDETLFFTFQEEVPEQDNAVRVAKLAQVVKEVL